MINFPVRLPLSYSCRSKLLAYYLSMESTGFVDSDAASYVSRVEQAEGQSLEFGMAFVYSDFVTRCKGRPSGVEGRSNYGSMQGGFSALHLGQRSLAGALVPLTGPVPTNTNFVTGDFSRTLGLKGDRISKRLSYNVLGTSIPALDRSLGVYMSSHSSREVITATMGNGVANNSDSLLTSPTTRFWRINGSSSTAEVLQDARYWGASKTQSGTFTGRYNGSDTLGRTASGEAALEANDMTVFGRRNGDYSDGRIIMSHFCLALDMAALEADVAKLQFDVATVFIVNDIINRTESADGESLSYDRKLAIYRCVKTLRDGGAWDDEGQFTMGIGARTMAGNLVPWVGVALTNNNFVQGDSDSRHGFKGGSNSKSLIGVPANTYEQDSFLAFSYVTEPMTVSETTKTYFGDSAISGALNFQKSASSNSIIFRPKGAANLTSNISNPVETLTGFIAVTRNSPSDALSYARGITQSHVSASTGNTTTPLHWFRLGTNAGTVADVRMFAFGYMRYRDAAVWRSAIEQFYQDIQAS